jgi:hypothetical protein
MAEKPKKKRKRKQSSNIMHYANSEMSEIVIENIKDLLDDYDDGESVRSASVAQPLIVTDKNMEVETIKLSK